MSVLWVQAVERQRKLDEIAERQRQREAEIEAKARAEREALAAAPPAGAPAAGKFVPRHLRGAAERPAEREPARCLGACLPLRVSLC